MQAETLERNSVPPSPQGQGEIAALLGRAGFIRITGLQFHHSCSHLPLIICPNEEFGERGTWGIHNGVVGICTADGDIWIRVIAPCRMGMPAEKPQSHFCWDDVFTWGFLEKVGVDSCGEFDDAMSFIAEVVERIDPDDLKMRCRDPFLPAGSSGGACDALVWFRRNRRRALETQEDDEDD